MGSSFLRCCGVYGEGGYAREGEEVNGWRWGGESRRRWAGEGLAVDLSVYASELIEAEDGEGDGGEDDDGGEEEEEGNFCGGGCRV